MENSATLCEKLAIYEWSCLRPNCTTVWFGDGSMSFCPGCKSAALLSKNIGMWNPGGSYEGPKFKS